MSHPIPRVHLITLGVTDLARATAFYRHAFETETTGDYDEVSFFCLPGVWIALYPIHKLAEDIGPGVPRRRAGFSGVTLACNASSRDEVDRRMAHAEAAGARIVKPAQDTFWGGYAGYFEDPEGFHWELAWGPMFQFDDDGYMRMAE